MEDSPLPLGICSTLSEKNRGLISNVNLSGFSSPAPGSCSVFLQYIAEPQTLQYAVPFPHALTSITDPFVLCIRASGTAIPPLPGRGSALLLPRRSPSQNRAAALGCCCPSKSASTNLSGPCRERGLPVTQPAERGNHCNSLVN